jgi:hypothetical protein
MSGPRVDGLSDDAGLTPSGMSATNRDRVEAVLADAAAAHAQLIASLPAELGVSLPADAQGITQAIDLLAAAAGLSDRERRELVQPHALNPAVLHARVFGRAPLARETVIASFVEGARVRADALTALADAIGGEALGLEVRRLLVAHPLPVSGDGDAAVPSLQAAYAAHERAAVMIAEQLDRD